MIEKFLQQPFAHLRRQPISFVGEWKDPMQETQLTLGEPVHVIEENNGWSRVQLPQQLKYDTSSGQWIGYPGWIESHMLGDVNPAPIPQNSNFDRKKLMDDARKFLDTPYLWGGSTPYDTANPKITGVDCSGLVYRLHKMQGVFLPRDAHDQWLKSTPIAGGELEAGDLIFIELKESPGRMDHVMLFAGNGQIIEAVIRPGVIREIKFEERIGIPQNNCRNCSFETDKAIFYFGKIAI